MTTWAGRYIARYCYAHLISKAGSLINHLHMLFKWYEC